VTGQQTAPAVKRTTAQHGSPAKVTKITRAFQFDDND
jgi:hypothetical protein